MRVAKFARTFALALPVLVLAACDEDPAAVGSGDAFAIVTNFSTVNAAVGEEIVLTAEVRDRGGTTLPVQVTATSSAPNFVVDSTKFVPELQFTRIFGKTTEVGVGTELSLAGGGLTHTVKVNVLSGPFPGTVALETKNGMPTLIFTSTAALFDDDATLETDSDDPGFLTIVSPTRAELVLPFGQGAAVNYTIGNAGENQFSLSGMYTMAEGLPFNDDYEPNDSPATSSNALIPDGTPLYGAVGSADADDFYTLTVTEAGVYTIELDWTDDADMDVYLLNSAGTLSACADDFVSCTMATGNHPERGTSKNLAPGTYRLYVNLYDGDGPSSTYRLIVNRQ